jgi:tRNA(adenine34) deaminase
MCAGAILQARVGRIVFGAWDEKAGAVGSVYDVVRDRRLPQRAEVLAGVEAEECARLLTDFFLERRP